MVARLRPVIGLLDPFKGFDTTGLTTEEVGLLAICADLTKLQPANSNVGKIQAAANRQDFMVAIASLKELLAENGLTYKRRRYAIDGERLASYRRLRGFTQAKLAELLGVTPGQISHAETGKNGFGLLVLLAAMSALDVPARSLLSN